MQRKLLLLSLKRLALLPKSSKKAIIREFSRNKNRRPLMYDKYTARPAVFLSCNFIERGPRGILCTRGDK